MMKCLPDDYFKDPQLFFVSTPQIDNYNSQLKEIWSTRIRGRHKIGLLKGDIVRDLLKFSNDQFSNDQY